MQQIDLSKQYDIQSVVLRVHKFDLIIGADKRRFVIDDTSCISLQEDLDEVFDTYMAEGLSNLVSLVSIDLRVGKVEQIRDVNSFWDYC